MKRRRSFRLMLAISLALTLVIGALGVRPARSAAPHLAYGFNLHADVQSMLNIGFDWLKGFPGEDLSGYPPEVKILFRFSAKRINYGYYYYTFLDDLSRSYRADNGY